MWIWAKIRPMIAMRSTQAIPTPLKNINSNLMDILDDVEKRRKSAWMERFIVL